MNCPICKNPEYQELDYGGYFYRGAEYPLVSCKFCGLKYILNDLSDKDIADLYQEEKYFDAEYAGGATHSYEENKSAQNKKADFALKFISHFKSGGKLLDVGCAGGYFVERARDKYNYEAKGIELSEHMVKFAKSRGLDVHAAHAKQRLGVGVTIWR